MRDRYRVFLISALLASLAATLAWQPAAPVRSAAGGVATAQAAGASGVGVATAAERPDVAPVRLRNAEPASLREPLAAAPRKTAVSLDAVARDSDSSFVSISGHDPAAPRALRLWRSDRDPAEPLALGFSRPDGSLVFPRLVAPRDGALLVATDAGAVPSAADAAHAERVPGRLPVAPRASLRDVLSTAANETEFLLRILPAEASGEVLLADASQRIFARYALVPRPSAAERVFDVAVVLAEDEGELLMAQEFADGRRSSWRSLALRAAP